MTRVYEVTLGVLLIVSLWSFAIASVLNGWMANLVWWSAMVTVSKLYVACLITAPVYREYLR